MTNIFDSLKIGDITINNRIIMAPLTRMRSKQPGNIPHELNAEYYSQRSGAGLIISEATQVSQQGQGYPATPGIHSQEQVEGWKLVTNAVHQNGGKIFLQLWHVGRISHSSYQQNGGMPVAPSAIKPSGKVFTVDWKQADYETPHELTVDEIESVINDFRIGASNSKAAGFDGVEVHGANGYLLNQFLEDGTNQRSDIYGGSIENRCRLLLEIVDVAVEIFGKGRVGVRLSPFGTFNDMSDSNPVALYSYLLKQLDVKDIAYVHVIEPRATNAGGSDVVKQDAISPLEMVRKNFSKTVISAGGYNPESAKEAVELGAADAIAFGRLYIANPDLAQRIRLNADLNKYDRSTFYGGSVKGYTDYPFMQDTDNIKAENQ